MKVFWKLLEGKIHKLFYFYFSFIYFLSRNPGHSTIIIEASKTMCLVARQFKNVTLDVVRIMFLDGLYFVSSHIDYFIDSVRNYTKIFFEELIALAAYHHANGRYNFADLT